MSVGPGSGVRGSSPRSSIGECMALERNNNEKFWRNTGQIEGISMVAKLLKDHNIVTSQEFVDDLTSFVKMIDERQREIWDDLEH